MGRQEDCLEACHGGMRGDQGLNAGAVGTGNGGGHTQHGARELTRQPTSVWGGLGVVRRAETPFAESKGGEGVQVSGEGKRQDQQLHFRQMWLETGMENGEAKQQTEEGRRGLLLGPPYSSGRRWEDQARMVVIRRQAAITEVQEGPGGVVESFQEVTGVTGTQKCPEDVARGRLSGAMHSGSRGAAGEPCLLLGTQ